MVRLRSGPTAVLAAVAVLALAAPGEAPPEGRSPMKLTSPDFPAGGTIPRSLTCDGEDRSPALAWTGAPDGTRSFALVMDDPDAPPGTWVHWVLYDLPGDARSLPPGLPRGERLEGGAVQGACWGVDRFSRIGYYGPCPPPGRPHRYVFHLWALDGRLGLDPRKSKGDVLAAIEGHVLAEAELTGTYGR